MRKPIKPKGWKHVNNYACEVDIVKTIYFKGKPTKSQIVDKFLDELKHKDIGVKVELFSRTLEKKNGRIDHE